MEQRVDRLTVLKKYMTMDDMLSYFEYRDKASIYDREKRGLKVIIVNDKKRLYKDSDIVDFLEMLRG